MVPLNEPHVTRHIIFVIYIYLGIGILGLFDFIFLFFLAALYQRVNLSNIVLSRQFLFNLINVHSLVRNPWLKAS